MSTEVIIECGNCDAVVFRRRFTFRPMAVAFHRLLGRWVVTK